MADAPAGGGGGISGAEIILLVVLGLGALSVLSGNPIKPYSASAPATTPVSSTSVPMPVCDITLTRPVKLEKLSQVATVAGTLTNCDPSMLAGQTSLQAASLDVQIVDSTGAPMSAYTPIPLNALTSDDSGSFDANIPLNGAPAAGTGYVIVVGPTQANNAQFTARVPVTFQ